jgi:hypothetical protein
MWCVADFPLHYALHLCTTLCTFALCFALCPDVFVCVCSHVADTGALLHGRALDVPAGVNR